ncbi:MAG: hypothetical protein VYC17_02220 [Nitrospinota bacterium]|nr:hypothetical protein [Nitrospinota bacterium]
MEIFNGVLAVGLLGLAGLSLLKSRQLERRLILSVASVNDLTFKFKETVEYLEKHIARVQCVQLKHAGLLIFDGDAPLDEVLSHPGARELLIDTKFIKKKEQGPFEKSLADQAKQTGQPLEPVLVALSNLGGSQ